MASEEADVTVFTATTEDTSILNILYFCSTCGKPFDKEPSRDRHVRYCGSRTRNRPRSCRSCNAAKTRCSFDLPCLRCTKRGIRCEYDKASQTVQVEKRTTTDSSGNGNRTAKDCHDNQDVISIHKEFIADSIPTTLQKSVNDGYMNHQSPISSDICGLDQNLPMFSFDNSLENLLTFNDFNIDLYQHQILGSKCPHYHSAQKPASWCTWMQTGVSLSVATDTNAMHPTTNSVLNFSLERPHAQHNANLIMQSLRSLPTMMLRRETFPWFIHPQSQHLSRTTSSTLPEAILTCMSISQMFTSRTVETKNYLWQHISSEYQRLSCEMYHMSEPELLAAIQACMIYLMMCIIDYTPEDEGNAVELLQILYDLYILAKGTDPETALRSEVSHPSPDWKTWMFTESRRRLTNLWFLIGCVMCVKTGNLIDTSHSYRILPLPAPKLVWEASTESAWRSAYDASIVSQYGGLVTIGDLVDAQRAYNLPAHSRKLERWNAGVDNLGSLLNLVEAMV